MAISGGDGSIVLTTKVDQTGLKKGLGSMKKLGATAGKAFLAIGAAAAAATVAITKMAVSAYADYEQLVGGVETLFKGSAQKVIDYANDAFYTAGVSANEYMKQVTSFSASLIRSTAGDTDKAADIANMALIDISDNVNKMGSSMESVTLAYQGFAKQQYMLLDNLKLGYGGTKTEMERLLKDAQALTGVKYDINNLADVYSAIHEIQEELGITGTTAKEAEKTITGSANMMKAAWQNVLSAIAGGGDLDRAINNLVYSIQKYFENIVPVVERSLVGIGRLIEKVAPMLVQNVASALIQSIPSLINAIYQMIVGLAKGIWEGIRALFTGKSGSVTADIKTSVGGIADSTQEASTGMEELGDATEKAGKQVKKSLAAFDDLQILTSNIQENTEPNNLFPQNINVPTIEINTQSFVEDLNSSMGELNFPWADIPYIDKINELIKTINESRIFESIKNIDWETITRKLEEIEPLAENIYNDISATVESVTAFLVDAQFDPLITDIKNIDGAFRALETFLSGDFTTTWDEVSKIFGFNQFVDGEEKVNKATTGIENFNTKTDEFLTFWEQNIPTWFEDYVVPYFTENKWQENLGKISSSLWDFFTGENGFINTWNIELGKWWDETVNPWFTKVKWSDLFKNVPRALDDVLTGVGGLAAIFVKAKDDTMEEVKKFFTKEHWEGIFGNITEAFAIIWNEEDGIIYKWRTGISNFFENEVTPFFEKTDWENLGKNISDGIWEGIKSLPSLMVGLVNKIIDGFQGLLNGAVGLINTFIDGYNGVASTLGIDKLKRFLTFDLSQYKLQPPKLAQGTVVPPNREFLAVLGDNTKEHEIVSPISTMKQAFAEAMIEMGGNFGGGNTEVVLEIDGREFGRAVVEQGNRENRRIGTRLVIA